MYLRKGYCSFFDKYSELNILVQETSPSVFMKRFWKNFLRMHADSRRKNIHYSRIFFILAWYTLIHSFITCQKHQTHSHRFSLYIYLLKLILRNRCSRMVTHERTEPSRTSSSSKLIAASMAGENSSLIVSCLHPSCRWAICGCEG